MANIKRAPSVGALVYKSTPRKHAEQLKKFNGRWTPETHAAAARMAAKPVQEAIPAPVMRKLWRLTGGWTKEWNTQPGQVTLPVGTKATYFVIKVNSELTVYVTELAQNMTLVWRGQPVACSMYWNDTTVVAKFSETGERHEAPKPPPPPPLPPPPKVPFWQVLLRPLLKVLDKATGKAVREEARRKEKLRNQTQEMHHLKDKIAQQMAEMQFREHKLHDELNSQQDKLQFYMKMLDSKRNAGASTQEVNQLIHVVQHEHRRVEELKQECDHLHKERNELEFHLEKFRMVEKDLQVQMQVERERERERDREFAVSSAWSALDERSRVVEAEYERMREQELRDRMWESQSVSHYDSISSSSWSDSGSSSSWDGGGGSSY